jgi:hypothetical protein
MPASLGDRAEPASVAPAGWGARAATTR